MIQILFDTKRQIMTVYQNGFNEAFNFIVKFISSD